MHSVKEASKMANATLEVLVVGTVCVEQALVASAVHESILWRSLVLHVGVLGGAGPADQVLSGLESGAHD